MADAAGPHVLMAVICERAAVMSSRPGRMNGDVLQLTGIHNEAVIHDPPGETARLADQRLVVRIYAGTFRGPCRVEVRHVRPDGSTRDVHDGTVAFDEQSRNWQAPLAVMPQENGVHLFEVYLDGRLAARTPYSIVHAG